MPEFEVIREHLGDKPYMPGDMREAKKADVLHLIRNGVLRAPSNELRDDGPTIGEFVAAGYKASVYPPHGYASRSSTEEIAAAVAAETAPAPIVAAGDAPVASAASASPLTADGEKADETPENQAGIVPTNQVEPAPANTLAPAPSNKAVPQPKNKSA